jgi:hypothetical protein
VHLLHIDILEGKGTRGFVLATPNYAGQFMKQHIVHFQIHVDMLRQWRRSGNAPEGKSALLPRRAGKLHGCGFSVLP